MTTTATHNAHDTTPGRVLFVAFELSAKTWKLGWKRNKKVAVHPCPEHLSVQDTRRREVALSAKR